MNELWRPTASPAALRFRSEILWRIRSFFHELGYLEVQTPTISRDTVVDRYLDPIAVLGRAIVSPDATEDVYFLQTSPEFSMKRLVTAGLDAIYQICPAYRAAETGHLHNPEFTMLEWYRKDEDFEASVATLKRLTDVVLSSGGTTQLTYQAAFQTTVELDPLACSIEDLRSVARGAGIELGANWDEDRDEWLNLIFAECVQPKLGLESPVVVTHYPASQAALARVSKEDSRTAERFELFAQGIELANGYHELQDAAELERRAVETLELRRRDGKTDLPTHSYLIDAMRSGMPACSGCALGLDRLVMVALGATRMDAVWPFPIGRA